MIFSLFRRKQQDPEVHVLTKAQRYRNRILEGKQKRSYKGNIFERFRGLDYLFERCRGASLLDIASCDGLISYEFARRGLKLVHGLELDARRVDFSQELFKNVPVESEFVKADLAVSGDALKAQFKHLFLPNYDIVLFLGIYHHLKHQMTASDLTNLVEFLTLKSRRYFAVRASHMAEVGAIVQSQGFCLRHEAPQSGKVRQLQIYERVSRNP